MAFSGLYNYWHSIDRRVSHAQANGVGVAGEYVGRVYLKAKQRPTYVIRRRYNCGKSIGT